MRSDPLFAGESSPPEDYWVNRGVRVIGSGDFAEVVDCRQVDTYRAIFDQLLLRPPADHEVFDLGCNVAVLGQLLRHWGLRSPYTGVDRNPHAIARARRNLPTDRFFVANLRSIPLADHSAPRVVLKDVLEHLEDFRPALREAARVARHSFIIACFLPWSDAPTCIRRHRHGFYENRYCREEVMEELARLGWVLRDRRRTREKDGRDNEVLTFEPTVARA